MMDPLAQTSTAGRQPPSSSSCADDDIVTTPPKGDKSMSRGLSVEEKTLNSVFHRQTKAMTGTSTLLFYTFIGCMTSKSLLAMVYSSLIKKIARSGN
jgi:hypothetical protein